MVTRFESLSAARFLAPTRLPTSPSRQAPTCPVCPGLECQCRPRYFAGQLLTEAELNAEQQYVIKKNRLHNLYLHGSGVVCGLEVICHPDCEGWVRVNEGYAIGACGDDIVVCQETDFDVLGAIQRCLKERRAQDDCMPWTTPSPECDADGCWYLTIRYAETPTRAITALRPSAQKSAPACTCRARGCTPGPCGGCGCPACDGNGNGNGAKMNGTAKGTGYVTPPGYGPGGYVKPSGALQSPATSTMPWGPQGPACEPSRICEGFMLQLCQAPPEEDDPTWDTLLQGTLLANVYECLHDIQQLKPPAEQQDISDQERYAACCKYLAQARNFLRTHPVTRCELLEEIGAITCPQPGQTEGDYATAVRATVSEVEQLLVRYLIDCICLQLLPPCPVDTGDDRLILACVVIEAGKIKDVCNWKGRQIAWTWPAFRYWLSAVPIERVLRTLIEAICCEDFGTRTFSGAITRTHLTENVASAQAKFDPASLLGDLSLLGSPLVGWFQKGGQ